MECEKQPHAVMFPYPGQGHINPMMQLAKKLISKGFFITFVNTDFNHYRMFQNGASHADLLQLPNLCFDHLPDGLPPTHGRLNQSVPEFTAAILALPGPFTSLVEKIMARGGPPITCIIVDSFCSWMQDVADKFGIPRVSLWTTPVHANLSYHFQSLLISEGYIPVKEKESASKLITCIPGVPPMPVSDYISFFQVEDSSDFQFQWHLNQCMRRPREALWNLGNNFYDLESKAIDAFKKEVESFIPVGPLLPPAFLNGESNGTESLTGPSLWPAEESSCRQWLDSQRPSSVLYISFGSIANMSLEQVEELARGVEESEQPFLWAVRPDQAAPVFESFKERTNDRGLVVSWAPQLLVLSHPSVGGFLTHCGWNSLMESICGGVPILAWPGGFAEQKMNARYVVDEWKVGMEFPTRRKDGLVGRQEVEGVVRALMGGSSKEGGGVRRRVRELRDKAKEAVTEGGSSQRNLEMFVQDMKARAAQCN